MKFVELLFPFFLLNFYSCNSQDTEHCWKDYYYRSIPSDALHGGTDKNGYPTYIGQFPISRGDTADIVPAIILENDPVAYGTYNSNITYSNANIKILCTDSEESKYQWTTTFISECSLIENGSNSSQALYVGKVNYKGQHLTGGFSKDDMVLNVPWIKNPEEEQSVQFSSFEMLIYCN